MKKFLITLIIILVTVVINSISTNLAMAASDEKTPAKTSTSIPSIIPGNSFTETTGSPLKIPNPIDVKSLQTGNTTDPPNNFLQAIFLLGIANAIIGITGGLALFFVVVGGIMMLATMGTPEGFEKGKKTVIWALAGLIISALSYGIVSIIAAIT